MKDEIMQLFNNKNYNEIFFRRKDIQDQKKEMKVYFDEFIRANELSLFENVKTSVYQRLR